MTEIPKEAKDAFEKAKKIDPNGDMVKLYGLIIDGAEAMNRASQKIVVQGELLDEMAEALTRMDELDMLTEQEHSLLSKYNNLKV